MKIRRLFALLLSIGIGTAELSAQETHAVTVRGPVQAGNGIPDGLGATLGRFFLLLERSNRFPEEAGGLGAGGLAVPLEVVVTSSTVTVEATTCSSTASDTCVEKGRGIAGVAGFPTTILGQVMALKLAGGFYLAAPDRYRLGSSIEFALEGSLYAGKTSTEGDVCDFRLFLGNPAYLLNWGADETNSPVDREYRQGTGAAVLLGDIDYFLFPGWLRGRVAENNGATVVAEFTSAEISPVRLLDEQRIWIRPDPAAARSAGLPEGVFGQIEVNYSGIATESRIVLGAGSNDVEVRVPAVYQRSSFLRGDCNGDGVIAGALTDAIVLLRYSFTGGSKPPCLAACDADGDGKSAGQVVDALYLLHFLFYGGPAPPPPFPVCGLDPTPEPTSEECEEPGCV